VPPPELCGAVALILLIVTGLSVSTRPGSGNGPGQDELIIHTGRIEGVAFSPDGLTAASASRDGTVKVWDVAGRRQKGVAATGAVGFASVAFAPDGQTLVAGGFDGQVILWDARTGREWPAPTRHEGAVRAAAFAPDGASVATAGDDGSVRLRDLPSGGEAVVFQGHTATVKGLAFAPDGQTLASVGSDGRVILWDVGSGRARDEFPGDAGPLWSVAIAPGGRSLAVGGTDRITVRDLAAGLSRTWRTGRGAVTAVCYLPDGATLASSSLEFTIDLWDVAPARVRRRSALSGQRSRVKAMAVSPGGTVLVTGGDDAVLRFWDLTPGFPSSPRVDALDRGSTDAESVGWVNSRQTTRR
jgi:WD40 repeat protein